MKNVKEIIDRMKKATNSRTYDELAHKLGVSLSALNSWKQRGKVPDKNILKCAQMYNIDYNWLLTGEGEMYSKAMVKSKAPSQPNSIEVEILSVRPSAGRGSNLEAVDLFDSGERLFIDKALFKVPPKGRLKAMQVDGYSMVPMLFPDSWVIVDETKEFTGDGLYVINWENILMVKLLEIDLSNNKLKIKSANPDYDSWEVDMEQDQRAFEIYGKVIRCII